MILAPLLMEMVQFFQTFYVQSILVWAWMGGLFYVALIVLTMIHALLNKRNIRAATGWIGLIWFAPVLGIVLYYLFGINRIRRRAKARLKNRDHASTPDPQNPVRSRQIEDRLPPGRKHLASLSQLTHQLTDLPLLDGNYVEPLYDGKEVYPAMLDAIEQAKRSITLCSYIFVGTGIGQQFVDALVSAHERGVSIRVIVDDVGARHSNPSAVKTLRRANIPVERFMHTWLPWKFRYVNLRNHRKIMVIDGQIGFTGGMNISKKYESTDTNDVNSTHRDLHFRLTGPIVSHLQYAFADDWAFCRGEDLNGDEWFPELVPQGDVPARGISHGPDTDYDKLRQTLLGAIASAEESLQIVTPYFLPDEELLTALKIASMRGLTVEIFIPADINLRLLQWASDPALEELIDHNVTIYRTGKPFDHSKLTIVDDCWVLFGSTNWDPRSLKLNFEFNVECYDESLVNVLADRIDTLRKNARVMDRSDFDDQSVLTTLRNNAVRLFSPYL